MGFHMKLYNILVNRVPGIREKYQDSRKMHIGWRKIISWFYLLWLNGQYYVLQKKAIGESGFLVPDKGKQVIEGSESENDLLQRPEDLARELAAYDVISFDVFDTLILRRLAFPEDVSYLVQKDLEYFNFKVQRKLAEWKSREKRFETKGDYEVSFSDIWEELSARTGIDPKIGMLAEIRAEQKVCYANPYFLEVIACLRKQKKKLIICSDMYLGEELIKELLLNCGYPIFDGYFISSDYHKSKHKGDLYKVIKKRQGKHLTYIHVGDNEFSDIHQARQEGFQTKYYHNVQEIGSVRRAQDMEPIISSIYSGIVNGYLYNGVYKETPEFEFGFIYGGLFVTGYCQFIHEYVRNHSIDAILFLARDGDILKKVYEYLYPEEKEKCKYAYWSRLSATKLSARLLKSHFIERMIIHKTGQKYKIKDLFSTMEIEDMLPIFLKKNAEKKYLKDTYVNESNAEVLISFINAHWEDVCRHYDEELGEAGRYYRNLLGSAEKAIAVDVGWVGSGPFILGLIAKKIWKLDCDLTGVLAGTCGGNNPDYEASAIDLAEEKMVSYMFSAGFNRDLWKMHDAGKGHNLLVELLLSSEQKSFRAFKKDVTGRYIFNTTRETINAGEIQRGILKFAELYKRHPLGHLPISGRDAAAPIALLYSNPGYINRLLYTAGIRANIE